MPIRTRSSNKDAKFKVYYSKKVPKQAHFPHRRKKVRAREERDRDASEKEQMIFLPEKMKKIVIMDSDDEGDDDSELETELNADNSEAEALQKVEAEQVHETKPQRRNRKRKSNTVEELLEQEETSARPIPKRKRKAVSSNRVRSNEDKVKHEELSSSPPESGQRPQAEHRRRRQSTMTQLVDGRRPIPGTREPEFRPLKRGSRTSWGGRAIKKEREKEQRTLTQMIPDLVSFEFSSDDSLDEKGGNAGESEVDEGNNPEYNATIAKRLAAQGLFRPENDGGENMNTARTQPKSVKRENDEDDNAPPPSRALPSIEAGTDVEEDEFLPTQYIEGPSSRSTRLSRHKPTSKTSTETPTSAPKPTARRAVKTRFGLLATPEKRRILEIPSSQSPPESPLSIHTTPQKFDRSPLKERFGNANKVSQTPSRRKQVTFQEPRGNSKPPPSLRKFRGVIQDSEDEDLDIEDDTLEEDQSFSNDISDQMHTTIHGKDIGADTQALLGEIDRACANVAEDALWLSRDLSEELGDPILPCNREQSSPELGQNPGTNELTEQIFKQELVDVVDMSDIPATRTSTSAGEQYTANDDDVKTGISICREQSSSTPTPVIKEEPSDNDGTSHPSPVQQSEKAGRNTDLDGDPIQVPRSPSRNVESQGSHSLEAEQQLQNEWLSYSQYHNNQPGPTSSMHVAQDLFSYDATPLPPRTIEPSQQSLQHSQATTIDFTQQSQQSTPKKATSQPAVSVNTTPRKIPNSQPDVSPTKPPSLYIPSSFPTPTKFGMKDWSSPILERGSGLRESGYGISQFGESIEDLSIPLPPPEDDDD